uniref:Uncharacterized protein n=2 Tax=Clastoptera arizonana TaxID=38151 RepID=A0A1B6CJC2_9HEMI
MQIVLPRTGSVTKENRTKSPNKVKPWTHFAEQGLQSPRHNASPPPLPPRSSAPWVCFDELPERRRTPKRITTLPQMYNYVNPDECSCECHESQARVNGAHCSERDKDRT